VTPTAFDLPRPTGLQRLARFVFVLVAAAFIAGCSSVKGDIDPTAGWTAQHLYKDAREQISSSNWKDARERLQAIEARYPFGIYAQQALMDLAYVDWRDGEPEQALADISRFQQQYPNHAGTDYMLYLKGLVTFTPPSAAFSDITHQDPSERDPKGLRESYAAFQTLVKRYPDSIYTKDAKLRLAWLVSTLAKSETHIAEYYYKRGAYVAAADRAQRVITNYQGTEVAEKALYIMYLSYGKLGLPKLQADAKRVLDKNFPNSKYYKQGLNPPVNYWNPINWF
jgi:outer membrane protein assembly factor BamD